MRYFRNILLLTQAIIIVSHADADADGVWKSYTNTNYIYDIAVSGDDLWCGTTGGVLHWNMSDETYECFTVDDGLPSNLIQHIGIDGIGQIWADFATYGIWTFDNVVWEKRISNITSFESMVVDRNGVTWIANRFYGVYSYDGNAVTHYTTEDGLIHDAVLSLIVDSNNVIWFGTKYGLSRFDGQKWTSFTSENGLAGDKVFSIAEDMNGVIWCATNKGVSIYDGNEWKTYTTEDGFPPGAGISHIVVDNDNVKWFGTTFTGLLRYDDTAFTTYSPENSDIPDNKILDLAIDSDGVLWLSVEQEFPRSGYGLTCFDGTLWKNYITEGPLHNIVRGVIVDKSDVKWFWTNGGISSFDGTSWTRYTDEDYRSVWRDEIDVVTDRDNVQWFGSADGARSFDGTTWTTYTTKDGLLSDNIYSLAVDNNNVKWFGTDKGVSSYDGTEWENHDAENGFVSTYVNAIAVDSNNVKWFGTHSEGLWRYDDITWQSFTENNSGLNPGIVTVLTADNTDILWIFMPMGGDFRVLTARPGKHIRKKMDFLTGIFIQLQWITTMSSGLERTTAVLSATTTE